MTSPPSPAPAAAAQKNALSELVRRGKSLDAIRILADALPELLEQREEGEGGDLPLHVAIKQKAPLEVLRFLAGAAGGGGGALGVKGKDGLLPLHLAVREESPLDAIECLHAAWPGAVREKASCQEDGKSGEAPLLHLAIGNGSSMDVIEFIYSKCPEAVRETFSDEHASGTPLHAAAFYNLSLDGLEFLCEQSPDALWTANAEGKLPVDLARSQGHEQVVAWLESAMKNKHPIEDDRKRVEAVVTLASRDPAAVSVSYIEHLRTGEVLGRGYFGTVRRGRDALLRRDFAVKAINTDILAGGSKEEIERAVQTFKQEQEALSRFRHPNIAALFAYAFPAGAGGGACYLLYELAEKGSLDEFLASELGRSRLSFGRRVQIAVDVMTAVQFLHHGNKEANISSCFHRDIKSANIVIKRDFTAQLIDCGLAKFVRDDNYTSTSTGAKGTAGYICPDYNDGVIPFVAACDIYSFGVVLTELWTGRLQNYTTESGTKFNFARNYLKARKNQPRDLKSDCDPFLDLNGVDMPGFMIRYAELALECMAQEMVDRPPGDEVLAELNAILEACSERKSTVAPKATQHSAKPEEGALCTICRSAARAPQEELCSLCSWHDQSRKQVIEMISMLASQVSSFREESRSFRSEDRQLLTSVHELMGVAHEKIDAMIGVLSHLDARLNNPVPRHFLLVKAELPNGWKHPREWLGSKVNTMYRLYFVCAATQQAVGPPVKLKVPREWVKKAAPVLAASLVALQAAAKAGLQVSLDLGAVLHIDLKRIDEMLGVVSELLRETDNGELLERLHQKKLTEGDVQQLNGKSYELVMEKAGEQPGWRTSMVPVRIPPSAKVLWVTKEVARERKYEVVNS